MEGLRRMGGVLLLLDGFGCGRCEDGPRVLRMTTMFYDDATITIYDFF